MSFVRAANPKWFFNNLTGSPVDDTYYAFFLQNDLPYGFQTVYATPDGTPWAQPIEFQPSAGLPDNIYLDPTELYRVQIRQGNLQTSPLIWDMQNVEAGEGSTFEPQILSATNMITNPQFADVYFNGTATYSSAGTYSIAPGWSLVLSGTGSVVVTQTALAGNGQPNNTPPNPPYYITINSNSWTGTVILQQIFNNISALFDGGCISVSLSAFASSPGESITIRYVPSVGNPTPLGIVSVGTGAFQNFNPPIVNLPVSLNTASGTSANISIQFLLASTSTISLSNIQIVGQTTPLPQVNIDTLNAIPLPIFQNQTYERTVDQEFNVYRNSIIFQPKSTLLAGWQFGLNPWQFYTKSSTNVSGNSYIADQTIVVQQQYVQTVSDNTVSSSQAAVGYNLGFQLTAVTSSNIHAIIQYIDPATIAPYWQSTLSSLVKANIISTKSPVTTLKFKMRLFYIAGLPTSLGRNYPIASWTAGLDPVFAAGVTAITPINDPIYTLETTPQEFAFDGFVLPTSTNANMTLGICLYTISEMNSAATADSVVYQEISLVPNQFSIACNPKTFDQSLRECQYYFCKTFSQGIVPASGIYATPANAIGALTYRVHTAGVINDGTSWSYPVSMRAVPAITGYNTTASGSSWYNGIEAANSGASTFIRIGTTGCFANNAQVSGDNAGDPVSLFTTADARL